MHGRHLSDWDVKKGSGKSTSWPEVCPNGDWPTLPAVERAGIEAVAYADVFGYPLTALELHRYLPGVQATPEAIRVALHRGRLAGRCLSYKRGYFTLSGRAELINLRRHRAAVAAPLWCQAERYGSAIASFPFVRLVAVSGALAVDNVEAEADIDYFIVTEPGRLWVCRAFVIGLVRLAARRGVRICPNYFLSERALTLPEHNLFAAHELAQMVPVDELATYYRMRQLNGWATRFLPNAAGVPRHVARCPGRAVRARRATEWVVRTPLGNWLERWEMTRKVKKFRRRSDGNGEARFCEDRCKGHFEGYGLRVLAAFTERLRALELSP